MNLCLLSGNLTRDPFLNRDAYGTPFVTLMLAVDEDGRTHFFELEAWSTAALHIAERFRKSDRFFCQAKARSRVITDADGGKRNLTTFRILEFR